MASSKPYLHYLTTLVSSYDATLGLLARPFSKMRVPSLIDRNHCASRCLGLLFGSVLV